MDTVIRFIYWSGPVAFLLLYPLGWSAMEMTPPEFGTARWFVSFGCLWAGVVGLLWEFLTDDPLIARIAVGVVCGALVFVVFPLTLRHVSSREANSSFEQTGAFAVDIPVGIGPSSIEIPVDANQQDPLMLTFLRLQSIARVQIATPLASGVEVRKPSVAEISHFLGRILQYYILCSVFEMQEPQTTIDFSTRSGLRTNTPSPVDVPDAQPYAKNKWIAQIESLNLEYLGGPFSGPDDRKLPKVLKLPMDTDVSVAESDVAAPSPSSYIVRFERQKDFSLEFTIETSGISKGILPQNFALYPTANYTDLYLVSYAVRYRFHGNGGLAKADDYRKWAAELFSGLKKRLSQS